MTNITTKSVQNKQYDIDGKPYVGKSGNFMALGSILKVATNHEIGRNAGQYNKVNIDKAQERISVHLSWNAQDNHDAQFLLFFGNNLFNLKANHTLVPNRQGSVLNSEGWGQQINDLFSWRHHDWGIPLNAEPVGCGFRAHSHQFAHVEIDKFLDNQFYLTGTSQYYSSNGSSLFCYTQSRILKHIEDIKGVALRTTASNVYNSVVTARYW